MNKYTLNFVAQCPVNGQHIDYRLILSANRPIFVEDISALCGEAAALPKPYHENIADFLYEKLGGYQEIAAFHHGVLIETTRGKINS